MVKHMKWQSDLQTLAVIPAVHRAGKQGTCPIQITSDNNVGMATELRQPAELERIYIWLRLH